MGEKIAGMKGRVSGSEREREDGKEWEEELNTDLPDFGALVEVELHEVRVVVRERPHEVVVETRAHLQNRCAGSG